MTDQAHKICKNCLYGVFHKETKYRDAPSMTASPEYVICKRYPPKPNLPEYTSSVAYGSFPQLRSSDWCGEYKSNTE